MYTRNSWVIDQTATYGQRRDCVEVQMSVNNRIIKTQQKLIHNNIEEQLKRKHSS